MGDAMDDACTCPDRRRFLRAGGLTLLVSAVAPALARAVGRPGLARARTLAASGKTLVYVFQRFGADGLNTVVPTESGEYATYRGFRPTLYVDSSDPKLGPLTPDFALHPLAHDGLYALWQQGTLAVLPDVGYPDGSRSHFDSQQWLDNGTPGTATTADGWLNRWLQTAPASADPLHALAFASSLPPALQGKAPALAITDLAGMRISTDTTRNDKFLAAGSTVYAQAPGTRLYDAEIAAIGRDLLVAVEAVSPSLPPPTVPYPKGTFGKSMSQLAQLLRSDLFDITIAEVDLPGWDTHANQQSSPVKGTFPDLLTQFSDGIKAFVDDLGPARMSNLVVVTASEFGRTARENGSLGTDHGSAWASFALGGGVRGGLYFGSGGWHGLDDLREGRDLKHSIDFRDVFAEVLTKHLGVYAPGVFPGWTTTPVGFL